MGQYCKTFVNGLYLYLEAVVREKVSWYVAELLPTLNNCFRKDMLLRKIESIYYQLNCTTFYPHYLYLYSKIVLLKVESIDVDWW